MVCRTTIFTTFLVLAAASSLGQQTNVNCFSGPLEKTYGGTKWRVYGCEDKLSVLIVAAPGNPAKPFEFLFLRSKGGYHLYGEGTGDKKITRAALHDLSKLSPSDFAALGAAAAAAKSQATPR